MIHRDALVLTTVAGMLMLAAATGASPAGASESRTADPSWSWPVDGDRVVLRPFIAPPTPYGAGHRGIDVLATSTTLLAPADGTVRFAGMVAGRPVLSIDHGGGVISSAEPVASDLVAGVAVARGDPIGVVLVGHCERHCVHFGVRVDGEYVNPLTWLGGAVWPVLLPTRHPANAVSQSGVASAPVAADAPVVVSAPDGLRPRPRGRDPATRTSRR